MEKQTEDLNYIKEFFINSSVEINISNFIIAIVISALLALIIKYVYLNCSQTLIPEILTQRLFRINYQNDILFSIHVPP